MATPHIEAKAGVIAKTVLMPGDPLRAKFIADTFLENVVQFNNVRGMLGFTGTYKGKTISVMGSGMGMPSIGIYSYELYKFYDVENIIRIGSCGAYTADLERLKEKVEYTYPDKDLNNKIIGVAKELNIHVTQGCIHSSDVFYRQNFKEYIAINKDKGAIAVEMESFALFHNAKMLGKKAACLLTVSDNLVTQQETSSEERQNAFTKMMEIALGLAE